MANYADIAAFVAEKQIKRTWKNVWKTQWPLLNMIKAKRLNFNTASKSVDGNSMLLPVNFAGPTTGARAGTGAGGNAFTPISPTGTTGFDQFKYNWARYENAFWLTRDELVQIRGGNVRAPIMPGKIQQLLTDFKKVMTTDLLGTGNGTGSTGNGILTGERYILSSSNSPGGLSQITYPVLAAGVVTNGGFFDPTLIDAEFDRINDLDRGPADFCQLSYTAGNNVYGKLRAAADPKQLMIDVGTEAKWGFRTFRYLDLDCFQDGRLGGQLAGSLVVGSSDSWYWSQNTDDPQLVQQDGTQRLPGTTSNEYMYDFSCGFGCDDPATNTLVYGIL